MKMAESSPKEAENIVGKGEIACNKQFLLFPQCFQKTCTADRACLGKLFTKQQNLSKLKALAADK